MGEIFIGRNNRRQFARVGMEGEKSGGTKKGLVTREHLLNELGGGYHPDRDFFWGLVTKGGRKNRREGLFRAKLGEWRDLGVVHS